MPGSGTTEVFEAELIDANSSNPFASPGVSSQPQAVTRILPGIGRASEGQIRNVIRSLIATDITYLILCFAWLAAALRFSDVTFLIQIGATLIAWCCFIRLVTSHGEFDSVSLAMVLSFPIPLFGMVIFFGVRKQACQFLFWNGYKPGFLGASPDHAEIAAMNADPNYRPSALFDRNGARRRFCLTLNHAIVAVLLLFGVAICIVGALA